MGKTITTRVVENARAKGVVVYNRRQWGSGHPRKYITRRAYKPHALLPSEPSDTLWQHISVTHDTGRSSAKFKADMRTLERIGDERFNSGVSYNWVIDAQTGEVGLGQELDVAGTHTVNHKDVAGYSYDQNRVSLAICVLGMPGVRLSQKAGDALVHLIRAHIEENALTDHFDYNPHSMVAFKECPTENVRQIMNGIKAAALAKPAVVQEEKIAVEEPKHPNRDAALPPLRKARNAAKKGSPRRRRLNKFLRWLRSW